MRRRRRRRRDPRPRRPPASWRCATTGCGSRSLDREPAIAAHQTSHSSGVIHAGIYYEPGSLKARLCVAGARRPVRLLRRARHRCTPDRQADRRHELGRAPPPRRARAAGGGKRRRGTAARRSAGDSRDRAARRRRSPALHSPNTGVVDFARVAGAFAADLERAGGSVRTAVGVSRIDGERGRGHGRSTAAGRPAPERRSSAPEHGPTASRVAAGAEDEPRIVPFRGAYLRLRPERSRLVRANVYPVPDPDLPFLGAHLTRGSDGAVLLGPSALIVGARDAYRPSRLRAADLRDTLGWPGTWRLLARFWRTGLTELRRAASKRAFVAEAQRFVPEPLARRFRSRAGGHPRPGCRPRRVPGRRLRGLADRARPLRPQRSLPRRDRLAAAREPDRGPARAPARLGENPSRDG